MQHQHSRLGRLPGLRHAIPFAFALTVSGVVNAQLHPAVEQNHEKAAFHITQAELNELAATDMALAFITAFDHGDEIFEFEFNALDGGGANVGNGQRYTRTPRPDLRGAGEWATHTPARATGPNGASCVSCHFAPVADGSGGPSSNVTRDPHGLGDLATMIHRNTPHIHGHGALQVLAEEMTAELQELRDEGIEEAAKEGKSVTVTLTTKGVNFGALRVRPDGTLITHRIQGVDEDLIVRPYQWKGNFASARQFNIDAAHQELGMQGQEVAGIDVDGDGDGIMNELTFGDSTALTIYLAAQPRPTTFTELASVGAIPPLAPALGDQIAQGEAAFSAARCDSCHIPELILDNSIFSEPSQAATHRDAEFAGGVDPESVGVSPKTAITFDLAADQPDNIFIVEGEEVHIGAFPRVGKTGASIGLFGDLKRHEMGPRLAEGVDETGHGRSVWLTKELWGVGTSGPYLHDGRATTLTEAIDFHGGEAQVSRDLFFALSPADQAAVIAFLNNMTIFLPAEEE